MPSRPHFHTVNAYGVEMKPTEHTETCGPLCKVLVFELPHINSFTITRWPWNQLAASHTVCTNQYGKQPHWW
jgi:hypothetical protein